VFHNNAEPQYFMGSADWMNRNLHSRIEVIFPVYDTVLCKELDTILQLQLKDNCKAAMLACAAMPGAADNIPVQKDANAPVIAAQQEIYNYVKQLNNSFS
jgi:polyphosphate kinase